MRRSVLLVMFAAACGGTPFEPSDTNPNPSSPVPGEVVVKTSCPVFLDWEQLHGMEVTVEVRTGEAYEEVARTRESYLYWYTTHTGDVIFRLGYSDLPGKTYVPATLACGT